MVVTVYSKQYISTCEGGEVCKGGKENQVSLLPGEYEQGTSWYTDDRFPSPTMFTGITEHLYTTPQVKVMLNCTSVVLYSMSTAVPFSMVTMK